MLTCFAFIMAVNPLDHGRTSAVVGWMVSFIIYVTTHLYRVWIVNDLKETNRNLSPC